MYYVGKLSILHNVSHVNDTDVSGKRSMSHICDTGSERVNIDDLGRQKVIILS